jgi:hypothetical protein
MAEACNSHPEGTEEICSEEKTVTFFSPCLAPKGFVFSLSSLQLQQNNGQFLIIHSLSLLSSSSPSPPLFQCNHNS